jgi:hypothetical protein
MLRFMAGAVIKMREQYVDVEEALLKHLQVPKQRLHR